MVHQLMDRLNDMDQKMRLHHLDEIDNFRDRPHLQDVVYLVAPQNLVAQNQDEVLTFPDVHLLHLQDVVVDAEPHHLLKMDCYQDVEDVEPHHLRQMDCYLDVALVQKELVQQVLEFQRFLQRALPLHAWQLLPYLQSILLAQA